MNALSVITRLASVLSVVKMSRSTADIPAIRRLMSGITAVVALTIVSGMMVGMLLIAALYGIYLALISTSVTPLVAFAMTMGIAVILTLVFVSATVAYARNLVELPKRLVKTESPLAYRAGSIVDAFMDGLLTREIHRSS